MTNIHVPADAVEKIERLLAVGESVSLPDVLRQVVAKVERPEGEVPVTLPSPVVLTPEQRYAIERLPAAVEAPVPAEKRTLTPGEVIELIEERACLDAVEEAIKRRKEAIRTTVFNHLDLEVTDPDAPIDEHGHAIAPGSLTVPGLNKRFAREIRQGSPVLSADALELQVSDEDGSIFTRDDFLACTTQVRVVDEAKVLLHLRRNPSIVGAIKEATSVGRSTASLWVRKSK